MFYHTLWWIERKIHVHMIHNVCVCVCDICHSAWMWGMWAAQSQRERTGWMSLWGRLVKLSHLWKKNSRQLWSQNDSEQVWTEQRMHVGHRTMKEPLHAGCTYSHQASLKNKCLTILQLWGFSWWWDELMSWWCLVCESPALINVGSSFSLNVGFTVRKT